MFEPAGDFFERFLVVDVETTGVYNSDRVVEVGVVALNTSGEIVDEWDTLVDPQRDVGPTHIHGITASMVSAAPRFEEVALILAARMQGAVLVAHNLAFDARMLANEFARAGAEFDPGQGICTMRASQGSLSDACCRYGICLEHHHRALADARATAQLLTRLECDPARCRSASVTGLAGSALARTLRRDVVSCDQPEMPYLARLAVHVHHRAEHGAVLEYLDLLDWAMSDHAISEDESTELEHLACDLGLTPADIAQAHDHYMQEVIAAALRDNRVTADERRMLKKVSTALGIEPRRIEEAIEVGSKGEAPTHRSRHERMFHGKCRVGRWFGDSPRQVE